MNGELLLLPACLLVVLALSYMFGCVPVFEFVISTALMVPLALILVTLVVGNLP